MIQILIAILAGVLTIAAPCILPVLPIVLGNSLEKQSTSRPLFITLGFVLSFAGLGLLFAVFTKVLGLSQETLRTAAIILLGVFGLFLIIPSLFEKLVSYLTGYISEASRIGTKFGSGNFGGLILGLVIGIIWTPCAGPVLGSILTLVATQTDLVRAGILLFAYSVGAAVPMLLISYGGQFIITRVHSLNKYAPAVQKVFGLLIIGFAVAMYFKYDVILQARLIEYYPGLTPKL
jgi:cytochrome c-type biogenesis protein